MFIEVHGVVSGKRFLLRPEHIMQLHEEGHDSEFGDGAYCTIYTKCGTKLSVKESYEEIKKALT